MRSPKLLFEILPVVVVLLLAGCGGETPPKAPVSKPPKEPVKITHFYASRGPLTRGEETMICYGVENADKVVIHPKVKELQPGFNRCFSFAPAKTTIYTLTATGAGGEATEKLAVQVLPPRKKQAKPAKLPLITTFLADHSTIAKGEKATLCYALENATSVTVDPPVVDLEPFGRCFTVVPEKTTTYRLSATGKQGKKEQRELTITVR